MYRMYIRCRVSALFLFAPCIYSLYLCLRYCVKGLKNSFSDKKKNDGLVGLLAGVAIQP